MGGTWVGELDSFYKVVEVGVGVEVGVVVRVGVEGGGRVGV